MKIILVRFEKDKIHSLECDLNSGNLTVGSTKKMSLESTQSRGEKYNKIIEELSQNAQQPVDFFAYHPAPPNFRGKIDEIRFANEAILNLFCYKKNIKLLELYKPLVRKMTGVNDKDFKKNVEEEEVQVLKNYSIKSSNKIFEGLVFLSLLKNLI